MSQTAYTRERKQAQQNEQPRTIRNKDIPVLSRVFYIMQAVCQTEKLRQWQKDRMFSITATLTGMPGASGGVPKGYDSAFAALSELDEAHETKIMEYSRELKRAERILNSIPSITMRTFVMMRYVLELSNNEIMRELNMTRRGFERACKCIEDAPDMAHAVWRERYYLNDLTEK